MSHFLTPFFLNLDVCGNVVACYESGMEAVDVGGLEGSYSRA